MQLSAGTLYGSIKRLLEQGLIVEVPNREADGDSAGAITGLRRWAAKPRGRRSSGYPNFWNKRGVMDWRPSAVKVYRALLFAYPAEFRHEYGRKWSAC